MKEKILILDANSILYRAFFALPHLTNKNGEMINAIYGFLLIFLKTLKEFRPDYVIACFDFPGPTFRHREFPDYKALRPPTPKELVFQIKKIKEILSIFSTVVLEEKGYEADDLIGTVVNKFPEKEKIIISGDSDLLQLIDEKTKVNLLRKGVKKSLFYDKDLLEKETGLSSAQIVDFKSLVGDSSDNVSGVKGIGPKTALSLIKRFGNLENLYKELEEKNKKNLNEKIIKKLKEEKTKVFLNKKILKIKKDVLTRIDLKRFNDYEEREIIDLLEKMGFKSLTGKISQLRENKLF